MSPRKKEEWIEVKDAADIISENSGRAISPDYVRLMAHKGRITRKPKDRRQNLYLKSDVEKIVVKSHEKPLDQREEDQPAQDTLLSVPDPSIETGALS